MKAKIWGMRLLLASFAFSAWAVPVLGQEDRPRSESGRHKPVPQVQPQPAPATAQNDSGAVRTPWFVGLNGGMVSGGDLFRTRTATDAVVRWQATVPFQSPRFRATLDSNAGFGIMAGRHLDDRWSVRLDLSSARLDVAAEAAQGQGAAVYRYDRMTVTEVTAGVEARLVKLPSYPYLNAGLLLRALTAARESGLDQTQLGARVGVGYLLSFDRNYSVRLEGRFGRTAFSSGDFLPTTTTASQPSQEFRPSDVLSILEVVLALQLNL